jgi:hypothetical protein
MKGRDSFTSGEVQRIYSLLADKLRSDRMGQKLMRGELREMRFYISDFRRLARPFGPRDFGSLIASGQLTVTG